MEELKKQMEAMCKNQQELEKKQSRIDQLLAEEREKVAKMAAERDEFGRESRERDKKIGQMNNEMQKLHKQLEDQGRTNRTQQQPLREEQSCGQILFRMPNFKAFTEGRGPSETVFGDTVEHINGLPWRIVVKYKKDWIELLLNCDAENDDVMPEGHCLASCQFSVVSRTKSDGFLKGELDDFNVYTTGSKTGWPFFAQIKELMDPKKGFYNAKDDTMTFKAKVVVKKPPKGIKNFFQFANAMEGLSMLHKGEQLDGMESSGQILFRMANFKAFSKGRGPAEIVFSVPVEHINRLPWRIVVNYKKDWIELLLNCNADIDEDEKAWHCLAVFNFIICSRFKCLGGSLDHDIFSPNRAFGSSHFFKFELLLDAKFGFYDPKADVVTIKAEMVVKKLPSGKFNNMQIMKAVQKLAKRHMELFGTE